MSSQLALAVALAAGLTACEQAPHKSAPTQILCVWDSAPEGLLDDAAAAQLRTPNLLAWQTRSEARGGFVRHGAGSSPSMSSCFADFLTGKPSAEHGLRSVAELGAQTLSSAVRTLAQDLPEDFVTLASVSKAQFTLQGLDRGIETWRAPALQEGLESWKAAEVWTAIKEPLEQALAGDHPVSLVLHFSDLRGDSWRQATPSRELLQSGLKAWIGAGGEIDAAFADDQSEFPLPLRLAKVLLRRKGDPRCVAMERVLHDARLQALDQILGELVVLLDKHGRLGTTRFELARGSNPLAPRAAGQELQTRASGDFEDLRSKVFAAGQSLPACAPGQTAFATRGLEFTLRLEHPQLFRLSLDDFMLGEVRLALSDVPELPSRNSRPWPENALLGPLLDLQLAGGRRLAVRVNAAPDAEVELLLESFAVDGNGFGMVSVEGASVEPHPQRPGALWIRGRGPLKFTLPPRAPSARLGVVLRIDGKRVAGSRMRYLTRVFSASESMTLGFSPGCWLQAPLLSPPAPDSTAKIHVQLVDPLALRSSTALPSATDLSYFRRLDPDE